MGGPDSLDQVQEYIYRLLSDRKVVRMPLGRLYQGHLAKFIAMKRAPAVMKRYQLIGGRSPLRKATESIAARLGAAVNLPVAIAMTYTDPHVTAALEKLGEAGVGHLLVIPLFPQYSSVSSEPILDIFKDTVSADLTYEIIDHHHDHPLYIRTLADQIRGALDEIDPELKTFILFIAHSIPVKYTETGDPYIGQIEETVALTMEELGYMHPHSLAYQSQVGPSKWHQPTLQFTAIKMGYEKVKQVVAVPLSFVSENLETLYDLDIEFRYLLENEGVETMIRIPAAGLTDRYIEVLADCVCSRLEPEGR